MNFIRKIFLLTTIITSLLVGSLFADTTNKQEKWFELLEKEYVGKGIGIDQDGVWAFQCVDVPSNYAAFIFPINNAKADYKMTLNWGNAADLYGNAYEEYFEKIPGDSGVIPERGDIVVWDGPSYEGHVAVISDADENQMELIHQFGYRQDGIWKTTQGYGNGVYGNIIGFLRPKLGQIERLNPGEDGELYSTDENVLISRGLEDGRDIITAVEDRKLNSPAYNSCVDLGIIKPGKGVSSNTYLTRLEGMIFVLRVVALEPRSLEMEDRIVEAIIGNVEDRNLIPVWAEKYSAFAIGNGFIKGTSITDDGMIMYSPDKKLTGEQMVTLIMRALGYKEVEPNTAKDAYIENFEVTEGVSDLINAEHITRDDAAKILFSVIVNGSIKEGKNLSKLSDYLISEGVFSEEDFLATLTK